jgi:hypothetical protein
MHDRIFAVVACMFASAATATPFGDPRSWDSVHAPRDVVTQPLDRVDLPHLISNSKEKSEFKNEYVYKSDEAFAMALDAALREFDPNATDAKVRRNRIQDRLILASNDLCENYKSRMKQKQSRFNFWSGSAATLFGAAGSLIPHAATAKIFSGLAGATTGIRAEYNQDYFADVAAHVITKAISLRRATMLAEFEKNRKEDATSYTIERALADAVNYHGACSLVGGLEEADKAVSTIETLRGVDTLNTVLTNIDKLRAPKAESTGKQ